MAAPWDTLVTVWQIDRLWLVFLGATLAGLIRGFSGFGTAMIFVPLAAQALPPVFVLAALIVMDVIGPLPAIPAALRQGDLRELVQLGAGALVGLPVGIAILSDLSPEVFRYAASLLTLGLLVALMGGLRYHGRLGPPLIAATGALSGVLAGAAGLAGPPAIMLYMARARPVAVIRANLFLFLLGVDVLMLALFAVTGLLTAQPVMIGVLLIAPYILALRIGAALFDPTREILYRRVAYGVIAASALSGLPLLKG